MAAQVFVKKDNTHGYTFLSPESMRLEIAEKKQKTQTHQQNILQLMTPKHIVCSKRLKFEMLKNKETRNLDTPTFSNLLGEGEKAKC